MAYKVAYKTRGKRFETDAYSTRGQADAAAVEIAKTATVVTILKGSDGADHPDNKGKYFLDRIVK
jgi:hypothetical protein